MFRAIPCSRHQNFLPLRSTRSSFWARKWRYNEVAFTSEPLRQSTYRKPVALDLIEHSESLHAQP